MRQSPASIFPELTNDELTRRVRRRGPRSVISKLRRALPKRCRALPGAVSGESETAAPETSFADLSHGNNSSKCDEPKALNSIFPPTPLIPEVTRISRKTDYLKILIVNIRCLHAHTGELEYHLDEQKPRFKRRGWMHPTNL